MEPDSARSSPEKAREEAAVTCRGEMPAECWEQPLPRACFSTGVDAPRLRNLSLEGLRRHPDKALGNLN